MQALWQFTSYLHQSCLNLGPASDYKEIYSAIVCGAPLKSPEFLAIFKQSGLMHIIVVSGSHLVFLSDILTRIQIKSRRLHCLILALYVCICQFQAPAFRSFIVFCLSTLSRRYALHMPVFYQHIISAFIALALFPHWFNSFSLKLSLLASIGLSLAASHLKQCLIIFLLLLPFISFANVEISSLINNILFSQIIGFILFPLSLISHILPFFVPISDYVWYLSIHLLQQMNHYFPFGPVFPYYLPKQNLYHWMYLCIALTFTKKR